jgi:RNA polymerase sigma-70 factor (ECF subfamily)
MNRLSPVLDHKAVKLELFLTHRAALIDYATPLVGDKARAEDVVQDAYIRFTATAGEAAGREKASGERAGGEAADGGTRIAHPVAYLYRIVRNLAFDWNRRRVTEGAVADPAALDRVPAATASPEREALYRDELRVVAQALAELPERTRVAFEMHRLGGKTLREIATRLNISVGLAHQLVRDAMTHCAAALGDMES